MAATRRLHKVSWKLLSILHHNWESAVKIIHLYKYFNAFTVWLKELEDIKKSGLKSFRDIQVDEQNILTWHGLIVPVSLNFLDEYWLNFLGYMPSYIFHRKMPPTTKELFGLKLIFLLSIHSNHQKLHSRRKSIILTLMKRAR